MYIGCRAVIISIFITFLLLCSPCSAENPYLNPIVTTHELVAEKTFNGFITSWYYSPGLTNQEYIISIQNLEDVNRETNITSLISNTNFNLNELSNILFEEYKLIPYTYTIDHYDEIGHSEWNEANQTWNNWTESVFNYTETIESEKLDWKACKMNMFSINNAELKENYGYLLIPKYNSKDKGDGTFNGTKIFKLTFNTPIESTPNGFGSSGMVALLLDEIEFCPYWNTSWSAYSTVTMNDTAPENDFQVHFTSNTFTIPLNMWNEMNQDGNDTRILNYNHTIEFSLWVEHLTARDNYSIWVNVTNNASPIYQWYYGNPPSNSVSDGKETSQTFEDFEEIGTPSGWSTESGTPNYNSITHVWKGSHALTAAVDGHFIHPSHSINGITYSEAMIYLTAVDNRVYPIYQESYNRIGIFDDATIILVTSSGNYFSTETLSTDTWYKFVLKHDNSNNLLSGYVYNTDGSLKTSVVNKAHINDTCIHKVNIETHVWMDDLKIRMGSINEPIVTDISEPNFYIDSLHYNLSSPYNHTIESDGTLTSNRSIIAGDDTNDTALSTGNSYLQINVYDNTASIVRNFTFTGDNLDWYQVANISGTYDLKNVSGTVETQSNGNFTTNIVAGTYWVVAAATTTGYTVSGTIYGAAGLGEGQVTITLGSDSTTTSSSGAYSFTNIPTGTYTLTASKPGLQDASTTITVSSDTTQDLTMALATSPDGGGQQSSDWALPFNISTPISRLDGLFTSLQVPSDPGKINLFWYCILGFGAFMFVDGTAFHFDKSRNNPVFKLKYRISAPLSLTLMFIGLLYIGLINWNSAFFINTLDWLAHSSITQPAIFGTGILLLGVFIFIDGTTFHFDKSRNNPVIKLKYHISAPLSLILIFIGLLYTGMINWNSEFFIRVFDWAAFSSITGPAMLGTVILLLGILAFIDGLAFCVDKSRKSTFLKIKYQVLITAGLGLGIFGAVISKLFIFS